ncbi:MAG TPA: invasin domain 3-containing protein [Gemmatimonadales bacterium]|nr:invasin domain 3-containing protein [Gemmatimonadales bacterium]
MATAPLTTSTRGRVPAAGLAFFAGLTALGLIGCGAGDLALPNQGQPSELRMVRGDRQSGTIGQPLADSLVVRVLDPFGAPVAGARVSWTPETGGDVNPDTSVTSADGQAATERVLGPDLGTYVTTAAVVGTGDPPDPVVFVTTGVAARLAFVVTPPATASSGVALDPAPVLQLQDASGADLAQGGVTVTAQIAVGGGSLDGATTATSDEAGRVTFAGLALRGAPGTRTLIFAAEGFAPASANVGLGVGAPGSIATAAGDEQTAQVATPVAVRPAVVVRDADGNPLEGIPVSFKVTGGGGSISGAGPVTGSDGVAAVGGWTLGQKAGPNSLQATLSGLTVSGSPVVFSATAAPGPVSAARSGVSAAPASITASSGSSRSTITVTARDAFDNPISGLAVSLSATGDGNSLSQPTDPTGGNGATTGFFSASTPGSRQVSATIAGTAVSQAATVTVTAGAPNAGRSGAAVPNGTAGQATTVEIQLRDAQGNAVAGQPGAIAVSVSGANPKSGLPATDQGGGRYTAAYTPTKAGADQIQVKVSGTAVPGAPFASVVSAGPADAGASQAVVPACVELNQLPAPVSITAFDAFGNRVTHGGDAYQIRVNQTTPVSPTDNGDGTYAARLSLLVGVWRIDITLRGEPIKGNPFQLVVPFPFSSCR